MLIIILITILALFICHEIPRYIYINFNPTFNLKYDLIKRANKKERIVISFTTTPDRIDNMKYMISSILSQSRRVDEIQLYLPKECRGKKYKIPLWLSQLSNRLKVFKIIECDRDWGPATKLIPALLGNKNSVIIYMDDDIVYNSKTVETLVTYSNIYPNSAICNSGHLIKRKKLNKIDILEGFSGVIVKTSFFDINKIIHIGNYPKKVFFNDDVYISGILSENRIARRTTNHLLYAIPYWTELIYGYILRCNPCSLSSTVNKDKEQFKESLKLFNWA